MSPSDARNAFMPPFCLVWVTEPFRFLRVNLALPRTAVKSVTWSAARPLHQELKSAARAAIAKGE